MPARSFAWGIIVVAVVATAGACTSPERKLTLGLTPAEHEASFPIGDASKHALGKAADDGPISCDSCHKGTDSFVQFSCVGCHEHREDLTNGIHAGVDQYRYDSDSCLKCHAHGNADDALGGVDDATHTLLYFPIDNASAHSAVQCSECHTNAADHTIVTCTSCHDHSHDVDPMLTVHGSMTGYVWDTASCLTCHARSEKPGTYDHTGFPTAAGTVHVGISCDECHGALAQPTDSRDWTRTACTSCHVHNQADTDAVHPDVPSYSFDSASCVLCHKDSQVPGVIQHTFFPIDVPATHALGAVLDTVTVECTTCHQNPANQHDVTCVSCHSHDEATLAPTHDPLAPDYTWTNAACLFCHPNGEPQGNFASHTYFPIAAATTHAGLSCRDCHASQVDRTLLACTSCHDHSLDLTEPIHRGMPGYAYDSASCFACHAQSQSPGLFDHEPYFPLNAPSKHTGLLCADCHLDRSNRALLNCTGCHLGSHDQAPMATAHTGVGGYSWSPASCVGCHPDGTSTATAFNHTYFPIGTGSTHEIGGAHAIQCADCHTTPGDNTKVECTACHLGSHDQAPMTTTHSGVPGFQWATTQCLFCHPNSEPSGNIDHARFFPIVAPAKHAAIACVDCHIDPNNRQTLGCAQCHANDAVPVATVHNGIPGFQNTSAACLQCHPSSEPTGTMDHLPFFPISAGTKHAAITCTQCHSSRTDRTVALCAQCHATVAPTPATSHGKVKGFTNNSVNCKQCHGDAQVDTIASHTVFSPSHHGAKCVDCHRTFRTDKPFAINFAAGVCTRCHSASCTPANHNGC